MTKRQFVDRTFRNETLVLDECEFIRCKLKNCKIIYRGDDYSFKETEFTDNHWIFEGRALRVTRLLQMIGMIGEGKISERIVLPPSDDPMN